MRIVQKTQEAIWPHRAEYHVLTYAEEGFSPLSIHGSASGISKQQLVAFSSQANERFETGSFHPKAPLSAIPRALIRDMDDENALCKQIVEFLRVNAATVKATKIIFDFRTPKVKSFVIAAIESAMNSPEASTIEDAVIIR